jgi:hypothetical protein
MHIAALGSIGLVLLSGSFPVRGQRPVASGSSRLQALAILELKQQLATLLSQEQTLKTRIAAVTRQRDYFRSLANRPYTLCPNHRPYPQCTHPELKARYDSDKRINLARAEKAQTTLAELNKLLATLDGKIQLVQNQIGALGGANGTTNLGTKDSGKR